MARRRKVGLHAHGCIRCRRRYEDACAKDNKPGPDGLCGLCRSGRAWWPEAWYPRDCCTARARPVNKRETTTYRLAGAGPWWICPECSRTFPFTHPEQHPARRQEQEQT